MVWSVLTRFHIPTASPCHPAHPTLTALRRPQDNSLGGRFPSALLSVSSLVALDLGNNAFNRTLPTGLTALTRLTYLCLVSNQVRCTVYCVPCTLHCAQPAPADAT